MAGLIYDSSSASRISDVLQQQEDLTKKLEKEKSVGNSSVLRYSILLAGAVITLIVYKLMISKKKK